MGAGVLRQGDQAIDFTLPDVASGTPRALSSWRGTTVVLLFYRGPWCGVCHQHLGQVRKRHAEIRDKRGEVVAVYPGTPEQLRPYYLERKIPFPILADEQSAAIDAYGVRNTWALFHRGIPNPATYVIDRDGVVRFADVRRQHYFRVPVGTLVAKVNELSTSGSDRQGPPGGPGVATAT
jgi:peroxiredoxin